MSGRKDHVNSEAEAFTHLQRGIAAHSRWSSTYDGGLQAMAGAARRAADLKPRSGRLAFIHSISR